jgi:hypothetical protein
MKSELPHYPFIRRLIPERALAVFNASFSAAFDCDYPLSWPRTAWFQPSWMQPSAPEMHGILDITPGPSLDLSAPIASDVVLVVGLRATAERRS